MMIKNEVILVDAQDNPIGSMEKLEAHQKGCLHRGFSVIIKNTKGQYLLQKRAHSKYHSPGLWTNSCSSHPSPGEETIQAAIRRLNEEMGIKKISLRPLFSFIYHIEFENSLSEHEFDHVLIGTYNNDIQTNSEEVEEFLWMYPEEINEWVTLNPEKFTYWFKLILSKMSFNKLFD